MRFATYDTNDRYYGNNPNSFFVYHGQHALTGTILPGTMVHFQGVVGWEGLGTVISNVNDIITVMWTIEIIHRNK